MDNKRSVPFPWELPGRWWHCPWGRVTIMHPTREGRAWGECVQMRICSSSVPSFSLHPSRSSFSSPQQAHTDLQTPIVGNFLPATSRPRIAAWPRCDDASAAVSHRAHICGFLSELLIQLRRDVDMEGSEQGWVTVQDTEVPATFLSCRWFLWKQNPATYYLFHFSFLKWD